jgi:hypothetical protein
MNIPTKFGSNGPSGFNSEGDCKSLQTKMTTMTTDVKWWQYLTWQDLHRVLLVGLSVLPPKGKIYYLHPPKKTHKHTDKQCN